MMEIHSAYASLPSVYTATSSGSYGIKSGGNIDANSIVATTTVNLKSNEDVEDLGKKLLDFFERQSKKEDVSMGNAMQRTVLVSVDGTTIAKFKLLDDGNCAELMIVKEGTTLRDFTKAICSYDWASGYLRVAGERPELGKAEYAHGKITSKDDVYSAYEDQIVTGGSWARSDYWEVFSLVVCPKHTINTSTRKRLEYKNRCDAQAVSAVQYALYKTMMKKEEEVKKAATKMTKTVKLEGNVCIAPKIDKVIFNPPATVVMWSDGTKTVVKAKAGVKSGHNWKEKPDKFSEEYGLAMAIAKKYFGTRSGFLKAIKDAKRCE
jgi:hypothetical protein